MDATTVDSLINVLKGLGLGLAGVSPFLWKFYKLRKAEKTAKDSTLSAYKQALLSDGQTQAQRFFEAWQKSEEKCERILAAADKKCAAYEAEIDERDKRFNDLFFRYAILEALEKVRNERPNHPSSVSSAMYDPGKPVIQILYIEDERVQWPLVEKFFQLNTKYKFEFSFAPTKNLGVEEFYKCKPQAVIYDLGLPCTIGREIKGLKEMLAVAKNTPLVVLSGNGNFMEEAVDAGASAFLKKPVDPYELISAVLTRVNRKQET